MNIKNCIPAGEKGPKKIADRMEPVSLNTLRRVLPDSAIEAACRAIGYTFRRRAITPILTILHIILAAIWPEDSFEASWHILWDAAAAKFPGQSGSSPSSGSVAKARGRLPRALFDRLWDYLRDKIEAMSGDLDRWRGLRVVLIDGTSCSMPDEPELRHAFGTHQGGPHRGRFPTARIVTLALIHTRLVLAYAVEAFRTAETTLMRPLLDGLKLGDLLLGDRHFAGANLYAQYLRQGLHFLTRAHASLNLSRLKVFHVYSARDFLAYVKVHSLYRKADPTLPREVLVRFVQGVVRIRGKRRTIWLATSLLDAERYPAAEIVDLFGKRWRIETLFAEIKVRLGADVLRSRKVEGIYKELAARMMAVNIVRMMMLEAAVTHQVAPDRISFVHALRAILAFAPAMALGPVWKLPAIYAEMLHQMADHRVPYRPGRNEPRAVRRNQHHYPTLKFTRAEWRLKAA